MIEQHLLKEQASTTYDQPLLINLASAANNNDKQIAAETFNSTSG
jgi:hypothetical protein